MRKRFRGNYPIGVTSGLEGGGLAGERETHQLYGGKSFNAGVNVVVGEGDDSKAKEAQDKKK